jgi:hypothetical protein
MELGPRGALQALGIKHTLSAARRGAKRALYRVHPWYATNDTSQDNAVFIVGCGRSGTTVLREMIDRHPNIAIGAETTFFCDFLNTDRLAEIWKLDPADVKRTAADAPSVVRFAEAFFRAHAEREGKPRWGDKTPRNITALPWLLRAFPNAHFIHIMRDGRDVACSRATFRTHRLRNGKVEQRKNPKTVGYAEAARDWVNAVSTAAPFRDHPRVTEVRYEAITDDPERELRRLCDFLGEDFDPDMIAADKDRTITSDPGRFLHNREAAGPIRKTARQRWRRDLSRDDRLEVARVAGELLIATGYAADYGWIDEPQDTHASAEPKPAERSTAPA